MDTIPLVVETEISFGKMFYCTQIFFFILSDVYVALWDCIGCTQNMSEIKVILVLSFLMHIYTQMLRVYVHNVIISAFQ